MCRESVVVGRGRTLGHRANPFRCPVLHTVWQRRIGAYVWILVDGITFYGNEPIHSALRRPSLLWSHCILPRVRPPRSWARCIQSAHSEIASGTHWTWQSGYSFTFGIRARWAGAHERITFHR